jgi:hypothetical protein
MSNLRGEFYENNIDICRVRAVRELQPDQFPLDDFGSTSIRPEGRHGIEMNPVVLAVAMLAGPRNEPM